jgi:hypothetical protein
MIAAAAIPNRENSAQGRCDVAHGREQLTKSFVEES